MSKALESVLLALARMQGDSDVAEADLRKVLATALKTLAEEDAEGDRDEKVQ